MKNALLFPAPGNGHPLQHPLYASAAQPRWWCLGEPLPSESAVHKLGSHCSRAWPPVSLCVTLFWFLFQVPPPLSNVPCKQEALSNWLLGSCCSPLLSSPSRSTVGITRILKGPPSAELTEPLQALKRGVGSWWKPRLEASQTQSRRHPGVDRGPRSWKGGRAHRGVFLTCTTLPSGASSLFAEPSSYCIGKRPRADVAQANGLPQKTVSLPSLERSRSA